MLNTFNKKTMKNIFVFCLLLAGQVNGQIYSILNAEITFENKLRTCLTVEYDANPNFVKKAFKDYCKDNFDVKIKGYGFLSNADILLAEDAVINNVSEKRLNIYNRILETPSGGSESKLFISFGYDFFVSPTDFPDAFTNMYNLLNNFSLKMLMDFYAEDVEDMNKQIKKINRDTRSNERTIKKYSKRVGSSKYSESEKLEYNGKIDVSKKNIENNKSEIKRLEEKIVLYSNKLSTLTNPIQTITPLESKEK